VKVTVAGDRMTVDFGGSSPAVAGPLNAVRSIAESAAWYVVRCVVGAEAGELAGPVNSGTFAPVEVIVPKGSLLDAEPPTPWRGQRRNVAADRRRRAGSAGPGAARADPAASQGR